MHIDPFLHYFAIYHFRKFRRIKYLRCSVSPQSYEARQNYSKCEEVKYHFLRNNMKVRKSA